MQLVKPIDIEDALRTDMAEAVTPSTEGAKPLWTCFAPPAPDDLAAGSLMVTSLGGGPATEVSFDHDVSIDCWAPTMAAAMQMANDAAGIVASLPLREFASGNCYLTAEINALPYINPDPNRPLLPRATFRATVGIRGTAIF